MYNYVGILHPYMSVILMLVVFAMVTGTSHDCDKMLTRNVVEGYESNLVDLSGRSFQGIEADACVFSSTVLVIDMSDNCLSNLPRHCFTNNTELYDLVLSRNSFYSVPPAIKSIQNLLHLNMSNNPISYLAKDDFKGMDQIRVIRFAQCRIESIHFQALDALKSLETADFSGNKLSMISCVDVTPLIRQSHINFSDNSLEGLNISCFGISQGIKNISVSDNKMIVSLARAPVTFVIRGNSGTLTCKEIRREIQNSNVPITSNVSCQLENGTTGHIVETFKGHDLSTPPPNPPPHNCSVPVVIGCVVSVVVTVTLLISIRFRRDIIKRIKSKVI